MPFPSIDKKELRNFAILLGIVLFILAGLNWWRTHTSMAVVLTVIAIASEACAWLRPTLIKPIFIVLTTIAKGIGWFNTRVLLCLVFYGMLAPVGIVMRIFRKDLIDQKIDSTGLSYWRERTEKKFDRNHYERQF